MPEMLEKIVRQLLTNEPGMQVEDGMASLAALQRRPPEGSVVVIVADPPAFAKACEALPDVRLVGIAQDWRQAMVRFSDMTMERLRDAVLFVAGGSQQAPVPTDEPSS